MSNIVSQFLPPIIVNKIKIQSINIMINKIIDRLINKLLIGIIVIKHNYLRMKFDKHNYLNHINQMNLILYENDVFKLSLHFK